LELAVIGGESRCAEALLKAGASAAALPASLLDLTDPRLKGKSKACARLVNAWLEGAELSRSVPEPREALGEPKGLRI
jgi:hypothetical protein